ncbi:hypothetical protein CBM2637_A60066 [Cupriavidus taiwanensis]|nr:hypothetical protein CBM2637_A60066 [Cupriavidus taiwanensis]
MSQLVVLTVVGNRSIVDLPKLALNPGNKVLASGFFTTHNYYHD